MAIKELLLLKARLQNEQNLTSLFPKKAYMGDRLALLRQQIQDLETYVSSSSSHESIGHGFQHNDGRPNGSRVIERKRLRACHIC